MNMACGELYGENAVWARELEGIRSLVSSPNRSISLLGLGLLGISLTLVDPIHLTTGHIYKESRKRHLKYQLSVWFHAGSMRQMTALASSDRERFRDYKLTKARIQQVRRLPRTAECSP